MGLKAAIPLLSIVDRIFFVYPYLLSSYCAVTTYIQLAMGRQHNFYFSYCALNTDNEQQKALLSLRSSFIYFEYIDDFLFSFFIYIF